MTGRLDSLLRVRGIEERQRAADVAAAEHSRALAARAAEEARARARSWHAPVGHTTGPDGLVRARLHGLALHDLAETAQDRTVAAMAARDGAHEAWSSARIRLRSVERLAEARAERERVEAGRREQAAADELALLRRAPDNRGVWP